jgi:hypothetical protein
VGKVPTVWSLDTHADFPIVLADPFHKS